MLVEQFVSAKSKSDLAGQYYWFVTAELTAVEEGRDAESGNTYYPVVFTLDDTMGTLETLRWFPGFVYSDDTLKYGHHVFDMAGVHTYAPSSFSDLIGTRVVLYVIEEEGNDNNTYLRIKWIVRDARVAIQEMEDEEAWDSTLLNGKPFTATYTDEDGQTIEYIKSIPWLMVPEDEDYKGSNRPGFFAELEIVQAERRKGSTGSPYYNVWITIQDGEFAGMTFKDMFSGHKAAIGKVRDGLKEWGYTKSFTPNTPPTALIGLKGIGKVGIDGSNPNFMPRNTIVQFGKGGKTKRVAGTSLKRRK